MSEAVEEPSAPSYEAETRLPDIMETITNLSSKSLYGELHHDPKQHIQRSILEREEFARIKAETEAPVAPAETPELQAFEETIEPYEELLAPVCSKKNWLSKKIDQFRTWRRERPKRRAVSLRTANDVQEFFYQNSMGNKAMTPFNPNFVIEKKTRIAKLISYSAPPHILQQAGLHNLSAQKLAENGVVMQDLRNYRRYAEDLPVFFQSIHQLVAAGFTRFHFDARLWTLNDIAKAYGLDPLAVAAYFGMTVRDLLAADVKPTELPNFNVKMQNIMADSRPFELLFALRMNPIQLQQAFEFQPQHLFNSEDRPRLTTEQLDILCTFTDWNHANLAKVGFNIEQLSQLCVPPELSEESILRVVRSSNMRKRN
jgi:hypothetical protein